VQEHHVDTGNPVSLFEAIEREANKLQEQTTRICHTNAYGKIRETITCGELERILTQTQDAVHQLKRVKFFECSVSGYVRYEGAALMKCEQGDPGALPVYETVQ